MLLGLTLILLILVTIATGLYVYKQAKVDVFRPVVAAGVILLLFHVSDAYYLIWHSRLHTGFDLSYRYFVYDEDNLILTTLLITLAVSAWMMGDMLGRSLVKRSPSIEIARSGVKFDRISLW